MNHEMTVNEQYRIIPAKIEGIDTVAMKDQATVIAEFIANVEPSEDSLKEAKAIATKARKGMDRVGTMRKTVKKEVLREYEALEMRLKEIEEILSKSDLVLRDKIKIFDEIERSNKRAQLMECWKEIASFYSFVEDGLVTFEHWLEPKHLNKTATIKKSIAEMGEFLEGIYGNLKMINRMDHADEIALEYFKTLDLVVATAKVDRYVEMRAKLKTIEEKEEREEIKEVSEFYTFTVRGIEDRNKVRTLLINNEIEYNEGVI